jgi:alkylation response protein AidB-like acyl-CoA dehydrogenase
MSAASSLSPEERDDLRSTARSFLANESSPERLRAVIAEEPGYDRALWDQMVELGWTTIHVAEEHGGAGYGYGDVAIVAHELGRALAPSPFVASALLASGALALAENDALAGELLARLSSGESLGAVALASADGSYDHGRLTASWEGSGGAVRLRGVSGFVLDADLASILLVGARSDDGTLALVAIDPSDARVRVERTPTVDETRRLFTVSFDDVDVPEGNLLCTPGDHAADLLDQTLAIGVLATACDAAGAAERMLEEASEYARGRMQFGKPIGSFQAVKHHCANMAIAVEASRAATNAGMHALDGERAEWPTVAAITTSYVGPECSHACALATLVFGGIGFTWEHDSHYYLKRAKLDEVLFGTTSWHRRRLADAAFPTLVTR